MMKELRFLFSALIVLGGLLWETNTYAQQESQYTQYMYNTLSINPAYAGSRGSLSILALYRDQWAGVAGAPNTFVLNLHSPIGLPGVGVGGGFNQEKIGPSNHSEIAASFSYTLPLNDNGLKLGFGVRGGVSLLNIDPNKLNFHNPNDYDLRLENFSAPVVGLGFFLHNDNWYVGLSTPNILETKYYDDVQISTASQKAHYYLSGGYVFNISPNFKLKPAAVIKAVVGAPVSVDVSANALLADRLTLGIGYRWDAAVSALVGFQITNGLMIGYAYDYDTTNFRHYNDGSHELFLRFELGTRYYTRVHPRFF